MCSIIPYNNSNIQITNTYEKSSDEVFIADVENVYHTEYIYRGIIVTDINKEKHIKELLEFHNHSTYIIDIVNDDVNYEMLDSRILIMNYTNFKYALNNIDSNVGLLNSSYNFIGITYDIDNDMKNKLIHYYNDLTQNNKNKTIII
jgi:hypothetical protein